MAGPLHPALKRVVFVTGKGGVGKTTVAAGIALRAGGVLVEFGDGESGKRALGEDHRKVKREVIEQDDALSRAATRAFGSRVLGKVVLGNFAVKKMLAATPILREFAMLECVRAVAADARGKTVVVDMPATGHGIAWLRVARQMRDLLGAGPLAKMAERIESELLSPRVSSIVIVTLPEAMVLEETLELVTAMERDLSRSPDLLIVNRVPEEVPEGSQEAAEFLAGESERGQVFAKLASVLKARRSAREEGLDVMSRATQRLSTPPLSLALAPVDASAADLARQLGAP